MKKIVITLVVFSSLTFSYGQSWQWGKRGGALEALDTDAINRKEQTYSLVTDANKNIYGLSRVGFAGLDVDNVLKTNFDQEFFPNDVALFSFGCDGAYRWSKIIGGSNRESVNLLQTDSQNNVYVAGKFGSCTNVNYPARIDDDFISTATSEDCRLLFLTKYNDAGVMQWIRMPQPTGVEPAVSFSQTRSAAIQVDSNGIIHWLTWLPPGSYADGAFVNTQPGSNWFILKYDSNGNYLSNIPINMQTTNAFLSVNFKINPFNGNFYFYTTKIGSVGTASIAGNSITHSTFLASFDSQGTYLWHREDSFPDTGYLFVYDIEFDAQSNIYVGGKIAGFNFGGFLGLSISEPLIPGFVLKTNPTATQLLWSSYNNKGSDNYGDIALNGDELAYTSYCAGTDFTWGTQTLNASNINNNEGLEVLLARFNKNTGACIGLTKIPGNIGFDDVGASLAVDASGDYLLGGSIGGTMYFNNNQEISNSGSQSDFFVAKYATEACQPLSVVDQDEKTIKLYPNPTRDRVTFDNSQAGIARVNVYNYLGQEVLLPIDCNGLPEVTIDMSGLSKGVYLVRLEGAGVSSTVKVMRE